MDVMKIEDKVYGQDIVKEKVLIDLINSKAVQRLKGIAQFGMPDEYYHIQGYTRYDHSIGVMLLLKRINRNLTEQVVGLLHDVSHTAFSHVIDWVVGDPGKEDYQDKRHLSFVYSSELNQILIAHGLDVDEICSLQSFPIIDTPAPDICADRLDYTLREIALLEDFDNIAIILRGIQIYEGRIIFKNKESALAFSNYYAEFQREHWGGWQAKSRYHILAEVLKKAFDRDILTLRQVENWNDFEVLDILKQSKDLEILEGLGLLREGFEIEQDTANGIDLKKKFRYVDPFIFNCGMKRLSDVDGIYNAKLKQDKLASLSSQKVRIKHGCERIF